MHRSIQCISILSGYKHCFCYSNLLQKNSFFVLPANGSLVGTLMTIGNISLGIAIEIEYLRIENVHTHVIRADI